MRVNTFQKYKYTADVYNYRFVDTTGGGADREYFFEIMQKVQVFIDPSGDLILYSPVPLPVGGRVWNVRDVAGNVLTASQGSPQGLQYNIVSDEPVLNPLGYVDTRKYIARKVL